MRYSFDCYRLDTAARMLEGADGPIHVEPQVFDVLVHLVENRERAVAKVELLDAVWGDRFVSESALTSRIKAARRAIGDDGTVQRLITTVHGHGYRFIGDVSGAAVANAREPGGGSRLAPMIAVDDEFPFVGRADEVTSLLDPMTEGGRGVSVALIGGAAGIGKSRLAVEAAQRAERDHGALVCAGRCDPELTVPFQPWRDAIAQLAMQRPEEFAGWAAGVAGIIGRLVPSLVAVLGIEPADREPDAYAAADAMASVFAAAASRPVVVVIDDLQWSDEPTRSLLTLLMRRHGNLPILVLATVRTAFGDVDAAVLRWMGEVSRSPSVHQVHLGALDRAAVAELSGAVFSGMDPGDGVDVFAHTDGHSLFVTETLRELQQGSGVPGLSATMAGLVTGRLERLSPEVRALVTAGSALGPEFSVSVAAQAAGLALEDGLSAADLAVRADFVHETATPDRLRFSHRLVPDVVLDALTAAGRARIHRDCADALRSHGAAAAEVAFHVLGSVPLVPLADAVALAREAAHAAVGELQFDQAIRLLERALRIELDDRISVEMLIEMGTAYHGAGRVPAGTPYLVKAAEMAVTGDWPDLLAAAALAHQGASPYRRMRDTATLDLLDQALARGDDLDRVTLARLEAKTAAFHLFDWRLADRDRHSAAALSRAAGCDPVDELALLESRWIAIGCPLMCDAVAEIDLRLEELWVALGRVQRDAAVPECVHLWRADGEAFRAEAFGFLVDADRRRGMDYWRSFGLRAAVAAFDGDAVTARRLFDDAAAIGADHWGESAIALHTLALQLCDVLEGIEGRALAALEALYGFDPSAILGACLAWEQARTGRLEDAETTLGTMRPASLAWFGEHLVGGTGLIAAGEAALLVGDYDWARAAEQALTPLADRVLGLPWSPSFAAADVLSRLAERRGALAGARAHRDRALELYSSLGAPAFAARLLAH